MPRRRRRKPRGGNVQSSSPRSSRRRPSSGVEFAQPSFKRQPRQTSMARGLTGKKRGAEPQLGYFKRVKSSQTNKHVYIYIFATLLAECHDSSSSGGGARRNLPQNTEVSSSRDGGRSGGGGGGTTSSPRGHTRAHTQETSA